jgi:hypothetical protein
LKHRASGKRVLEFNTHQIAKAFTSHTERQGTWNNILQGVADEVNRVKAKYPGVPIIISGDMNRDNGVNFPGLAEDQVTLGPTMGGNHYDQFFYIGQISPKSHAIFDTMSDHKAVVVNFEITTPDVVKPAAKPSASNPKPTESGKTETPHPGPPTSTPVDIDLRRRTTFRARPRWRYFAQRMTGDGATAEILHPELPLSDVNIEDVLTGHNALSGTISPEFGSLIAEDGRPLLEEQGTAIWAEESGNIHGGGILTHSGFDGPDWSIECVGLTGYLQDLPYASSTFFVEEDPLNIFRHIWTHVQSQEGGNVGLDVDPLLSGLLVGVELEQVEFDTQAGPVSFESGPYKLAYYQDHDLDENAGNLAADTPFDWHEEHYWSGDVLRHRLRLGYPTIGFRRTDLRFVVGENVFTKPSLDRDGAEYADEVWVLGAGEGAAMLRGVARANINRLRRVAVVTDPSLRSQSAVNAAARRELAWRNKIDVISEVVVRDHPHADVGSLSVGDEIRVQGDLGWIEHDSWYRVISRKITPASPDRMALTLIRSDRIAA